MPTEIEQIEDLIITEIKRTSERTANGVTYPVIGIQNADTWSGGDIEEMLQAVLTPEAVRVIYTGGKHAEKKLIGAATNHDKTMTFRIALVLSNLRSRKDGSRAGYAYLDAIDQCFTQFKVTPLRGYLWPVADELLLVKYDKFVYGFEFERRTI